MKFLKAICCVLFLLCHENNDALSIIRDPEIEEILTEITQQIFKVANLDPKTAKVYVINSSEINAFTIGNGYIFINSETLLHFKPEEIFGILAHETAHIAAGHVNRHIHVLQQRAKNFTWAMLAGILGAAVTGSEEAIALILGYAMADDRMYLRYSRGEEMAADALGAEYMKKLGYGIEPMVSVFEDFQKMEIMNGYAHLPTFIRSHPKSCDRINALRRRNSSTHQVPQQLVEKYKRIKIKLKAFLGNPITEMSDNDKYSRAVLYHRTGKLNEAIALLQDLLKKYPNDKYYKETLAQVFYENGRLQDAIKMYAQVYTRDAHILIKIDYARALVEAKQQIDFVIQMLESAKYQERFEGEIFRLLGKAYGIKGREGVAMFMFAQEQMLGQNYQAAEEMLQKALIKLDKQTEKSYIKKTKEFLDILKRERAQLN